VGDQGSPRGRERRICIGFGFCQEEERKSAVLLGKGAVQDRKEKGTPKPPAFLKESTVKVSRLIRKGTGRIEGRGTSDVKKTASRLPSRGRKKS